MEFLEDVVRYNYEGSHCSHQAVPETVSALFDTNGTLGYKNCCFSLVQLILIHAFKSVIAISARLSLILFLFHGLFAPIFSFTDKRSGQWS